MTTDDIVELALASTSFAHFKLMLAEEKRRAVEDEDEARLRLQDDPGFSQD